MNNLTTQDGILTFCLNFLTAEKDFMNRGGDFMESARQLGIGEIIMNHQTNSHEMTSNAEEVFKTFFKVDTTPESSPNMQDNIKSDIDEPNLKPKELSKIYTCTFDGCGKSFEYKWILDRHINSHFCFKLFKCEYSDCQKAYKSKENLNLHIKNKHLHQKPYQCKYCESKFSHRNGNKTIKFYFYS